MRLGAVFACAFLIGCGSDSDNSFDESPTFEALAGVYAPAQEATAATISASSDGSGYYDPADGYVEPDYGVSSIFIDETGFVRIFLVLPREPDPNFSYVGPLPPVLISIFGYVDDADDTGYGPRRLAGSLNQVEENVFYFGNGRDPEPPPPEFAQLDLYAYPDLTLSGVVALADGSEHIVDLAWSKALEGDAGLQVMQGSWRNGLSSWWQAASCDLSLEFDDAGNGFGSLNEVCAVDIKLRPLASGEVYTLDANTSERIYAGDSYLFKADVSVSGCQQAAEYAGDLQVTDYVQSPSIYLPPTKFARLRYGNDETVRECTLTETADTGEPGRLPPLIPGPTPPGDDLPDYFPQYDKQVIDWFTGGLPAE